MSANGFSFVKPKRPLKKARALTPEEHELLLALSGLGLGRTIKFRPDVVFSLLRDDMIEVVITNKGRWAVPEEARYQALDDVILARRGRKATKTRRRPTHQPNIPTGQVTPAPPVPASEESA